MKETKKAHHSRLRNGDYEYLRGKILDIGCGDDKLECGDSEVIGWDKQDGDAQYLESIPDETYDCVYSSHCLEHMVDVPVAIKNWARVTKKSGYVYIVVPDWTAYEHRCWPSIGNDDHKASFSIIDVQNKPSHAFYTLKDFIKIGNDLGLKIIDARLVLDNYDFTRILDKYYDQTVLQATAHNVFIYQKIKAFVD